MGLNRREIPRSARNDKLNYFFRSLISEFATFPVELGVADLVPYCYLSSGPAHNIGIIAIGLIDKVWGHSLTYTRIMEFLQEVKSEDLGAFA